MPMSKRTSLFKRVLLSLLRSRVEPIQIILALSIIAHGLWVLFPQWVFHISMESISTFPRVLEMGLGGGMIIAGGVSVTSLLTQSKTLMRQADFAEFVSWVFLTVLAYLATSPESIIWVGYATLALVSAFIYLNVSVGADYGTE